MAAARPEEEEGKGNGEGEATSVTPLPPPPPPPLTPLPPRFQSSASFPPTTTSVERGFLNQQEGEDACLRRRASLGSDDGTKLCLSFFIYLVSPLERLESQVERGVRRKKHPLSLSFSTLIRSHLIGSGSRSTSVPRLLARRTPGSGEQSAASSCWKF